jgi:hypothetical protein
VFMMMLRLIIVASVKEASRALENQSSGKYSPISICYRSSL